MAVSALAIATQGFVGLPAIVTTLGIAVQGLLSYTSPVPPIPPIPPPPVIIIDGGGGAGGGGGSWSVPDAPSSPACPDDPWCNDIVDEIAASLLGSLSPLKHADISAAIVLAARKPKPRK